MLIDVDGDHVTITASSGEISVDTRAEGSGFQIESIDATAAPGADVIVSVDKARGGNGRVHIGQIDGSGVDLGRILIPGDLGRIVVGSSENRGSLGQLKVQSIGAFETSTGAPDLKSFIFGNVGKLSVRGDVRHAEILATAFDRVAIGGSLRGGLDADSGSIQSERGFHTVTLGGDLVGGLGKNSGTIVVENGHIGSIYVGGSIRGGDGDQSGAVQTFFSSKTRFLLVHGSIIGGSGTASGWVLADVDDARVDGNILGGSGLFSGSFQWTTVGSLHIRGSVLGGRGYFSGSLVGQPLPGSRSSFIRVDGDLIGSSGFYSGQISIEGTPIDGGPSYAPTNAFVGGSLRGGSGIFSGAIIDQTFVPGPYLPDAGWGNFGTIKIGKDLIGGIATGSGIIGTAFGSIRDVIIGGSIIDGRDGGALSGDDRTHGTIFAFGSIGSINIGDDLIGGDRPFSSTITARYGSIGSVTVGGSIVGGAAEQTSSIVAGSRLGSLQVDGNIAGDPDFPVSVRVSGRDAGSYPYEPIKSKPGRIDEISVGQSVNNALIIAGAPMDQLAPEHAGRIGRLFVGGNWSSSAIVSGVSAGPNGTFGDSDDEAAGENEGSSISSVIIAGQINTFADAQRSTFESHKIEQFFVGGAAVPLLPGGGNDFIISEGARPYVLREL